MPTPMEMYQEMLQKRRDQDAALEEFQVQGLPEAELSESGEPVLTPEEMAMNEAGSLEQALKLESKKANIAKLGKKLNDSEDSNFTLKGDIKDNEGINSEIADKFDSNDEILGGKGKSVDREGFKIQIESRIADIDRRIAELKSIG